MTPLVKWIFCCGMPRSASTLQYQIAAELVENHRLGKRKGWGKTEGLADLLKKESGCPGLCVVKTHIPQPEIVREIKAGRALGLYIYRDIRDAVVSNLRKRQILKNNGQRKKFIKKWTKQWLEYYHVWTRLPGVLVSQYEDVVQDIGRECGRIAEHLGFRLNREERVRLANEFSMEAQRARIRKLREKMETHDSAGLRVRFDPHTQLHDDHIHMGEIGGWRDVLDEDEMCLIESTAGEWLRERGYDTE